MRFQGVLLDIEDVLCHTGHLYAQARQLVLQGMGMDAEASTADVHVSFAAQTPLLAQDAWQELSAGEQQMLLQEMDANYRQLLATLTPCNVLPEASQMLTLLRQRGLRLAVASSHRHAMLILRQLGLDSRFDVVVDGCDVDANDDSSALLQKAAECLYAQPSECVVWTNDSAYGEAAALSGFSVARCGNDVLRLLAQTSQSA